MVSPLLRFCSTIQIVTNPHDRSSIATLLRIQSMARDVSCTTSLSSCFTGSIYRSPNHDLTVVRGAIRRNRFPDLDDDDEVDGDRDERKMANTAQERITGCTMIRAAPVFPETSDTACMPDAANVIALVEFHAQRVLKEKKRGTTRAPSDRTSTEMRDCQAKPAMGNVYTAFSSDVDVAKTKGKAKDPTIYGADAHESNEDFGTTSGQTTTWQGYGRRIPRSQNLDPVLVSQSSATMCLHGKNAVSHPVNNIHDVQMTLNNTHRESLTISEHSSCTEGDSLNQREATHAIDAKGKHLHCLSGSASSELQAIGPVRYHSGSACGFRSCSSNPSFITGQTETHDESLEPQIQITYLALPTDLSQTSLYSKTLSPLAFPSRLLSVSSISVSFEEVIDSLLVSVSIQMTTNPLHEMGNHCPRRTNQQIHHHCHALSNDDGMEGNGQSFHLPPSTGQEDNDTQRDLKFRFHHELHDPRSCSASLCNHVDTLRAHVLQTRQTMTGKASLIIYQGYGSYNMAQQRVLAGPGRGAEPSQAQDTPQSTADPSLEANNQSHDYFNSVPGEMLEGLTSSSVSRHTSRKRSRQHTIRSRRPSSAPPSSSSKNSSRATQTRVHGAAALSLLLRVLCLAHTQPAQQAVAVAPESGSLWLQCHPISLPLDNDNNNNNNNNNTNTNTNDDDDARDSSTSWLAIIDMEAMWE